ncbi:MAG: hypothetical protein JWN80_3088 [Microbacteriaceae bacterium]|jgi:hypothetical protein|nr:hypothetical protein [Microbacteriaceae bacterium]
MPRNKRSGEYTLRSGSSAVIFWIGAVVLGIVVVVPLVSGQWRVSAFAIAPALLLVWALWIALYRPAVRYDSSRAVVINMGRTHVLPWPRVSRVRQGIGLQFELVDGGHVVAVAVPPPRRTGNVASFFDRRTRPVQDVTRDAELLDSVRVAAAPGADPVASHWDVVPLAIGVVLVVAVVVEVIIGI